MSNLLGDKLNSYEENFKTISDLSIRAQNAELGFRDAKDSLLKKIIN